MGSTSDLPKALERARACVDDLVDEVAAVSARVMQRNTARRMRVSLPPPAPSAAVAPTAPRAPALAPSKTRPWPAPAIADRSEPKK